jgi:hypothetical protein
MLTLQILNLEGKETEHADYKYIAWVNGRSIASGIVLRHRRSDGWRKLIERISQQPDQGISETAPQPPAEALEHLIRWALALDWPTHEVQKRFDAIMQGVPQPPAEKETK